MAEEEEKSVQGTLNLDYVMAALYKKLDIL